MAQLGAGAAPAAAVGVPMEGAPAAAAAAAPQAAGGGGGGLLASAVAAAQLLSSALASTPAAAAAGPAAAGVPGPAQHSQAALQPLSPVTPLSPVPAPAAVVVGYALSSPARMALAAAQQQRIGPAMQAALQ